MRLRRNIFMFVDPRLSTRYFDGDYLRNLKGAVLAVSATTNAFSYRWSVDLDHLVGGDDRCARNNTTFGLDDDADHWFRIPMVHEASQTNQPLPPHAPHGSSSTSGWLKPQPAS